MNIGSKVKCINTTQKMWSINDMGAAEKYLTEGSTYTVDTIEVHSWHARVTLKEIPNVQFSDCRFEVIE